MASGVVLDLVVTALRKDLVQRLIESLSRGTAQPGMVSIISNEIDDVDPMGLNVRIIRFSSKYYPVGYKDVVIRCNVGLFSSEHQYVMFAAEDHIAAPTTIEDALNLFRSKDYWWGHHRMIDFANKTVTEIMSLSPEQGVSRERGVNREHSYQSCYSGSFGAKTQVLRAIGGFDMAFACHHAGEDQQIGLRLTQKYTGTNRVFIHEPPFWWHPSKRYEWGKQVYTNLCSEHNKYESYVGKYLFERCRNCVYYKYIGPHEWLFGGDVVMMYDHDKVIIEVQPVGEASLPFLTRG